MEEQDQTTLTGDQHPFEMELIKLVSKHMDESKRFLGDYHRECVNMHKAYHDARDYVNIRKKNRFPSGFMQEQVDQLVADMRDKLFYTGSPATCVGVEDTDKADADAKQEMLVWQDHTDDIFGKMGIWLRDCALYKNCWGKVEYTERFKKRWAVEDVMAPLSYTAPDGTDTLILNPQDNMPVMQPTGEKQWVEKEIPIYRGASAIRIDPINVFFTKHKRSMADDQPIAVREEVTKEFFQSEPYFYNHDKIGEPKSIRESNDDTYNKRAMLGLDAKAESGAPVYEYVEWQGLVSKKKLFEYLGKDEPVDKDEKCWAIIGIVDDSLVVRCEETPFCIDGPNLICGTMLMEENEVLGGSFAEVISPAHFALEELNGMILENFKQAIDAFWVINSSKIVRKKEGITLNKAGGYIETNDAPDSVMKRVEQPPVAPDMYVMEERLRQNGKSRGGQTDIATGKGDRAAETLGEANLAQGMAVLRQRDRLKTFEKTFVEKLYEMRNDINAIFLDQTYVYGVIGEKAIEWREITPDRIRAAVDFVCESSQRETNKAVLVQQMLQYAELAPIAISAGQPVRIDWMLYDLGESGFNVTDEKLKKYFPLIAMELDEGMDVNGLLFQGAIAAMGQSAMIPGGQEPQKGPNLPQPLSESDAITSANQRNAPNVTAIRR